MSGIYPRSRWVRSHVFGRFWTAVVGTATLSYSSPILIPSQPIAVYPVNCTIVVLVA